MQAKSSIGPFLFGSVEKSRQRRSRHFSVLTSCQDAPRAKMAVALPSTSSGQDWTDPSINSGQAFLNRPEA